MACWKQKLTNVEIKKCLNKKEDLHQKVLKRKLELLGHIARMDNSWKFKSMVMGKMNGDSRKRRPYREWLDNMKEWLASERPIQISPRTKQMETGDKMFAGYLQALDYR